MKHYIITIFAMLALSVGSASCSEDEPLQGTGQQTTPNNGTLIPQHYYKIFFLST